MNSTLLYLLLFGIVFGAYALYDLRRMARVRVGEKLSKQLLLLQLDVDKFLRNHYTKLSSSDRVYARVLANLEGTELGRIRRLQRRRRFDYPLSATRKVSQHGIDLIATNLQRIENRQLIAYYRQCQQLLLEGFEAHLPEPFLANVLPPKVRLTLLGATVSGQSKLELERWYKHQIYELR